MPSLSEQIRRAAKSSEISQAELAKRLGTSRATVCRFLNDDRELSASKMDKLAQVLGLERIVWRRAGLRHKPPGLRRSARA